MGGGCFMSFLRQLSFLLHVCVSVLLWMWQEMNFCCSSGTMCYTFIALCHCHDTLTPHCIFQYHGYNLFLSSNTMLQALHLWNSFWIVAPSTPAACSQPTQVNHLLPPVVQDLYHCKWHQRQEGVHPRATKGFGADLRLSSTARFAQTM